MSSSNNADEEWPILSNFMSYFGSAKKRSSMKSKRSEKSRKSRQSVPVEEVARDMRVNKLRMQIFQHEEETTPLGDKVVAETRLVAVEEQSEEPSKKQNKEQSEEPSKKQREQHLELLLTSGDGELLDSTPEGEETSKVRKASSEAEAEAPVGVEVEVESEPVEVLDPKEGVVDKVAELEEGSQDGGKAQSIASSNLKKQERTRIKVNDKPKPLEISIKRASCKIFCLICFIYPLLAILISALFSIPLVFFGEWDAADGFFEILTEISNAKGEALTNGHSDTEDTLKENFIVLIFVVLAGFVSLGIFGCFLGIFSGGPLDRPILVKAQDLQLQLPNLDVKYKMKTLEEHLDEVDHQNEVLRDDYQLYSATRFAFSEGDKFQDYLVLHSASICVFCTVILPLITCVISIIFGAVLYLTESQLDGNEWSFRDAYYTVFTELLDLKVELSEPPPSESFAGQIVICIVSLWASGFFFVILGLLAGPTVIPLVLFLEQHKPLIEDLGKATRWGFMKSISLAALVVIPGLIILFSLLLGLILWITSPFTLGESISEVLAEITNMQSDLKEYDADEISGFTRFVLIMIGLFSIVFFALCLGVVSYIYTPRMTVLLGMKPDYSKKFPVRYSFGKLFLFLTFGVPFIAVLISAVFGGLLAAAESTIDESGEDIWTYEVGFFMILSELLDINVDIYKVPVISDGGGKLIISMVGCFSFSFFTLILAVVGGPVLVPIVHFYAGTTYDVTRSHFYKMKQQRREIDDTV